MVPERMQAAILSHSIAPRDNCRFPKPRTVPLIGRPPTASRRVSVAESGNMADDFQAEGDASSSGVDELLLHDASIDAGLL